MDAPSTSTTDQPGTGEGQPESTPRKIAPIPSKPSLPGVREVRDSREADPENESKARVAREAPAMERLFPTKEAKPAPKTAPKADGTPNADENAEKDEPEEGAQTFSFAGQKFKDVVAAENAFKTMAGRAKKAGEAVSLAQGWHAHAEKLEAERARLADELDKLRSGKTTPEKPAPGAPKPAAAAPTAAEQKAFIDSVDWDFFREMQDEKGADYAAAWLFSKYDESQATRFDALRAELLEQIKQAREPHEQAQQMHAVTQEAISFFQERSYMAYPEGHALAGYAIYPELQDEAKLTAICTIWKDLDPGFAFTQQGFDYAVLMYRARNASSPAADGERRPDGDDEEASTSTGVLDTLSERERASSATLNGRGTPRPSNGSQRDAAAAFVKAIGESGNDAQRRTLGFGR